MEEAREKRILYSLVEKHIGNIMLYKERGYPKSSWEHRRFMSSRLGGMIDFAEACGIITDSEWRELIEKIEILWEEVWSVEILLKGYNTKLKKWVQLMIVNGISFGQDWDHVVSDSIKRYTGQMDVNKEMLWEDDEIINESTGTHMFIRYGEYEVYFPVRERTVKNVGFYLESEDYPDMPLGETDVYARKVLLEQSE